MKFRHLLWENNMIEIYQLKITVNEVPDMERIIWIKSTTSFFDLHDTIQWLFGFDNSHLFEFYATRHGTRISDGIDDARLAYRVRLSSEFKKTKKMYYTYDFGDCWELTISLQKILPYDNTLSYPVCISGKGGMLIEDCGGSYSYNLIAAWCRNKTKENRAALLEQYDDEEILEDYRNFLPDQFNREKINKIIGEKSKI